MKDVHGTIGEVELDGDELIIAADNAIRLQSFELTGEARQELYQALLEHGLVDTLK